MSHVKMLLTTILIGITFQATAAEYTFVASDNSKQTKFCMAAGSNDLTSLKREIRKLRRAPHQHVKPLVDSMRCNGQNVTEFAHRYEASDTLAFLNQHSSHKAPELKPNVTLRKITQSESDGSDAEVIVVHVSSN
jgi:hypothetical protein